MNLESGIWNRDKKSGIKKQESRVITYKNITDF